MSAVLHIIGATLINCDKMPNDERAPVIIFTLAFMQPGVFGNDPVKISESCCLHVCKFVGSGKADVFYVDVHDG